MHLKKVTCCLSFLLSIAFTGCDQFSTGSTRVTPAYYLLKYDRAMALPAELNEISGLVFDTTGHAIYTVNDEMGTIHKLTMGDSIQAQMHFGNDGDYEGIELVNGHFYVLESDGDLYQIPAAGFGSGNDSVGYRKFESIWDKMDAEGLCYLPSRNLLLIAVKDFKGEDGQKRILGFDLQTETFLESPVFLISVEEIAHVLFNTPFEKFSLKVNRTLATEKPNDFFKPSGIAVHPFRDEIYVINGTNNLMAIFDLDMHLLSVHPLALPEFRQPEGITFDSRGTMYISNEARGRTANILQFNYYE